MQEFKRLSMAFHVPRLVLIATAFVVLALSSSPVLAQEHAQCPFQSEAIQRLQQTPQSTQRDQDIAVACGRMQAWNCQNIPPICSTMGSSGTTSTTATCEWNGTFKGKDKAGQLMTVTLTQTGNIVQGGWEFTSTGVAGVPQGQPVKATITMPPGATVSPDGTLTGPWTQDKGNFKDGGTLEWKWKGNCAAFSWHPYWSEITRR